MTWNVDQTAAWSKVWSRKTSGNFMGVSLGPGRQSEAPWALAVDHSTLQLSGTARLQVTQFINTLVNLVQHHTFDSSIWAFPTFLIIRLFLFIPFDPLLSFITPHPISTLIQPLRRHAQRHGPELGEVPEEIRRR
jgi:hypothetical protein